MPAVARELSITYGGFTVGGNTDRIIDSHTRLSDGFANASFEFTFIIRGTDEASFKSACQAAEDAYRIPRQDFTVVQGAQTLKSLKQSDNTGLDADPVINKGEHMADTGRSRRYTVHIEFGRPADNVTPAGLRSNTTHVTYGENRRREVTIAGVWTAIPSGTTSAWAGYNAGIDAYATTQLAIVDPGTTFWELQGQPRAEFNTTNKVLEFSRTYKEKVYPDAGATTGAPHDPDLVNQQFKVGWAATGPGDSPGSGQDLSGGSGGTSFSTGSGGANTGVDVPNGNPGNTTSGSTARLGKVILHWEASVDKTRTIDTKSKYINTVRPWLITEAAKVMAAGYGPLALVEERADLDRDDNRILVDMEFWAIGPANIIEQSITTIESKPSYGHVLVPRWDGNPLSKYRYQGPAQQLRIVREVRRVFSVTADTLGKEPQVSSSQVPVSRDVGQKKVTIGLPGNQFTVTDITIDTVIEFYSGGGGGGGGGATTPNPVPGGVPTTSPGTNFFPSGPGGTGVVASP